MKANIFTPRSFVFVLTLFVFVSFLQARNKIWQIDPDNLMM